MVTHTFQAAQTTSTLYSCGDRIERTTGSRLRRAPPGFWTAKDCSMSAFLPTQYLFRCLITLTLLLLTDTTRADVLLIDDFGTPLTFTNSSQTPVGYVTYDSTSGSENVEVISDGGMTTATLPKPATQSQTPRRVFTPTLQRNRSAAPAGQADDPDALADLVPGIHHHALAL